MPSLIMPAPEGGESRASWPEKKGKKKKKAVRVGWWCHRRAVPETYTSGIPGPEVVRPGEKGGGKGRRITGSRGVPLRRQGGGKRLRRPS